MTFLWSTTDFRKTCVSVGNSCFLFGFYSKYRKAWANRKLRAFESMRNKHRSISDMNVTLLRNKNHFQLYEVSPLKPWDEQRSSSSSFRCVSVMHGCRASEKWIFRRCLWKTLLIQKINRSSRNKEKEDMQTWGGGEYKSKMTGVLKLISHSQSMFACRIFFKPVRNTHFLFGFFCFFCA